MADKKRRKAVKAAKKAAKAVARVAYTTMDDEVETETHKVAAMLFAELESYYLAAKSASKTGDELYETLVAGYINLSSTMTKNVSKMESVTVSVDNFRDKIVNAGKEVFQRIGRAACKSAQIPHNWECTRMCGVQHSCGLKFCNCELVTLSSTTS